MAEAAKHKANTIATQKTAEAAADNATLAADAKRRLLQRLINTEKKFPTDATEVRATKNGQTIIYRLRDLTAAYKDLTADMVTGETAGNELLSALMELERKK